MGFSVLFGSLAVRLTMCTSPSILSDPSSSTPALVIDGFAPGDAVPQGEACAAAHIIPLHESCDVKIRRVCELFVARRPTKLKCCPEKATGGDIGTKTTLVGNCSCGCSRSTVVYSHPREQVLVRRGPV